LFSIDVYCNVWNLTSFYSSILIVVLLYLKRNSESSTVLRLYRPGALLFNAGCNEQVFSPKP